ncbi:hypothetical protein [Solitalea canadensis]|uniref:Uncharacterized protein n=1 Tax=Solitalea canadensis (strain ATCC 29591 / DSM 3403 / JCM 21819 / LMG 8368 / NBRC 15130 / NCIMB 12057 / USAM 9D) TaxID=929556 RepID=H8KWI5_SOLCM|nr:hypothetical protein [Solitalea canadensis]AFD08103.1 hypothetical protein Solca_3090 [Solitalea canadensis DSM 3403]
MDTVYNGFMALLSFCVVAAILWYGIRFLKAQTELTELKIDKIKREIDILDKEKHNTPL